MFLKIIFTRGLKIVVVFTRGFNNKFMIDIGSPLAAIYSTSTMEHHHFNMAINILQQVINSFFKISFFTKFVEVIYFQEHHNIFASLNLYCF